ncbi:MAG TPA: type IV secretion system protein VirB10 [Acidocella sp.]|jgi:type IV secretion system protein VirB10|uniref:type IV secretion system protein VirB10 n=1 Tax=Acidocella sp. TaxID=50710 RepID=UPI002C2D5EEE|nr:type IV secretion system protein VirB10 [Acidocella sp.]HVE21793.1 type IV secretion system protein VirB10 [Acidocella sp.]
MSGDDRRDDEPALDNAWSPVGGPKGKQIKSAYKLATAGVVLVVFMAFIWLGTNTRGKPAEQTPAAPLPQMGFAFKAPPISEPAASAPMSLPMPKAASSAPVPGASSPIFAFAAGVETTGQPQGMPQPAAAPRLADGPGPNVASPSAENALTARLQPGAVQAAKAELLPHPDMTITQGTIIPCTLQTAINTELPGYVKCVLSDDVRGTTGNVVLLDRGTTVVGEIQRGMLQGENRVFILWDRAETPKHVVITLASPGTDELGRSGVPGGVDTHFWQRFGSAIMLSVIQGALQTGTALAANSGNSTGVAINSFGANADQLSDTSLQNSINIPPTLEKNQGDNVAIFVARDLDFSDVYSLQAGN